MERSNSHNVFESLGAQGSNGAGGVTKENLLSYISDHAELWAMLSVNLGLDEERCRKIAVDVAFQIAVPDSSIISSPSTASTASSKSRGRGRRMSLLSADVHTARVMTEAQFHHFREQVILNPKGQQLFFHRTVFAAFDSDQSGFLDR